MKHQYSVHLVWSADDAAFIATVMELPGCMADGETQAATLEALDVVIDEWIATAKEEGRPVPPPFTAKDLDAAAQQFRRNVQDHVQSEVAKAVQSVLQNLSQFSPALMGGHDPADFWKRQ